MNQSPRSGIPTRRWKVPSALVVFYLLSRCGFYLAGVRLNPIGVEGHQNPRQVDLALLKSHFVQSI